MFLAASSANNNAMKTLDHRSDLIIQSSLQNPFSPTAARTPLSPSTYTQSYHRSTFKTNEQTNQQS
jgi:hypothetical protein